MPARRSPPAATIRRRGLRVYLRAPRASDAVEFLAAAKASRGLHGAWVQAPATRARYLAFVRRFAADGGSTILISHLLGEVLSTADRIVVMRDGVVVRVDRAEAYTRASLVAAMGHTSPVGWVGEERKPSNM
jgi:hypothetical protein